MPAREDPAAYLPVGQEENENDNDEEKVLQPVIHHRPDHRFRIATYTLSALLVVLVASNVYLSLPYFFSTYSSDTCPCPDKLKVPQYFQTSPELWAGPTATGNPAFMAQTRVFEPSATYVPNEPLQTSIPIEGMKSGNDSIFKLMGFLSPYSPSPGFGVDEYPIPDGADIVQVQMLSRHGARYPTGGSNVEQLAKTLENVDASFKPKGPLAFLQDWRYNLGYEILVPKGRQELYDSGVLHSYMYGKLYNPQSKLIVRTTVSQTLCLVLKPLSDHSADPRPHAQVSGELDGWFLWPGMVRTKGLCIGASTDWK